MSGHRGQQRRRARQYVLRHWRRFGRSNELKYPVPARARLTWLSPYPDPGQVDLSVCAWYQGVGICSFGCWEEPHCQTSEPDGGWNGWRRRPFKDLHLPRHPSMDLRQPGRPARLVGMRRTGGAS